MCRRHGQSSSIPIPVRWRPSRRASSSSIPRSLARHRYGPGSFKIDYALDGPVPWTAAACLDAGYVAPRRQSCRRSPFAESEAQRGEVSERPFVIVRSRVSSTLRGRPLGKHTFWAYCHVPFNSRLDMTERIERQLERFAPGFRDVVISRHVSTPRQLAVENMNLVGGSINGGVQDVKTYLNWTLARPGPYQTPNPAIFRCSAATPPGAACMEWPASTRPNAYFPRFTETLNEHLRCSPCRIERGAPHAPGFPKPVKPQGGRTMPETGPGRGPQSWFASKGFSWGLRGIFASMLAGGVANALAAKRKKKDANKNDDGSRESRDNKSHEETRQERADRRERNSDEESDSGDRDRRGNNRDREHNYNDSQEDQDGKSGRVRRRDRDEPNRESEDVDSDRVVSKRQNNNNNNNNNNNQDDEPDDTTDDTDDDSDRGNRGNAGSGFFDQPLATKARRRSNDFEGEGEEEDDGTVIDVDSEGESTFETGSIFFSTGPEGLEVVTRNITYTAAPTPTPTPFPRLELPERERLDVFGDRTLATSTPVPSAPSAPTSPPPPPVRDVPADSGDTPPVTPSPSTDTSGGDTSGGFLS